MNPRSEGGTLSKMKTQRSIILGWEDAMLEKNGAHNGNETNGVPSERYLREIGISGDGGGMGRRAR